MSEADVLVEDRVREALSSWAEEVRPSPSTPAVVRRRVAARKRRRLTTGAGVFVVAAGVAVVAGGAFRSDGSTSISTSPDDQGGGAGSGSTEGGAGAALGDPALFVLDPPWRVSGAGFRLDLDDQAPTYLTEMTFDQGDVVVMVSTFGLGTRFAGEDHATVPIRGVVGRVVDLAGPSVRIDWDEGGMTLEATATAGVATAEELAALLADLRIVDQTGFIAALPPGIGNLLLVGLESFPLDEAGAVQWSRDVDGVRCMLQGGGQTLGLADPELGCPLPGDD